jgi:hypothetical protein
MNTIASNPALGALSSAAGARDSAKASTDSKIQNAFSFYIDYLCRPGRYGENKDADAFSPPPEDFDLSEIYGLLIPDKLVSESFLENMVSFFDDNGFFIGLLSEPA